MFKEMQDEQNKVARQMRPILSEKKGRPFGTANCQGFNLTMRAGMGTACPPFLG
jgi:hypothetical protein